MWPVSFLEGFLGCLSQEISWVIGKFGLGVQNKAEERLTEFWREHTAHSKHPLPTTQEMTLHMDITRWSNTKIRLIILFAAKDGEKTRPGADCSSDHELLIAKFRHKFRKV